MISIIVFEFFLLIYGILVNTSVYILDFKLSLDHGPQWWIMLVFQMVFWPISLQFLVVFGVFLAAFLCNFGTFVGCLKQCLPFLFNFQVNFNELAIIYPTVLFPPNIYIANFVFCLVIFLYIYGFIEYYAEY